MCGFCGLISNRAEVDVSLVSAMLEPLAQRGPDAAGLYAQQRLALGHRRLSILDLAPTSQQPMLDSELGIGVAFNGCIYNFRELRKELQANGYRFFSDGDTEVIIKAYHAWGAKCVERFLGMFAFALWERDTGRVVLARDRLGISRSTIPKRVTDFDSRRASPRCWPGVTSIPASIPPPFTTT